MTREELLFEATKTLNNIKNHDFTVADYKMCKKEATVTMDALDMIIRAVKFDGVSIPEIFNSMDKAIEDFNNAIH